jgi:hypothetical protein
VSVARAVERSLKASSEERVVWDGVSVEGLGVGVVEAIDELVSVEGLSAGVFVAIGLTVSVMMVMKFESMVGLCKCFADEKEEDVIKQGDGPSLN